MYLVAAWVFGIPEQPLPGQPRYFCRIFVLRAFWPSDGPLVHFCGKGRQIARNGPNRAQKKYGRISQRNRANSYSFMKLKLNIAKIRKTRDGSRANRYL